MEDDSIAKLIGEHLMRKAPAESLDRASQVLSQLDENQLLLLNVAHLMTEGAVSEEAYDLHFAATAILWVAGLLSQDKVTSVEDLRNYATWTWERIQGAIEEIVEEGLADL